MTSIHAKTIRALAVRQRLLETSPIVADWFHDQAGRITLEILQRAADAIGPAHPTTTLLMSNATRREYLKLLAADRRYS